MTSQGFNQSGLKQQEPSRPIFSGGYDAGSSPRRLNSYNPSRQGGNFDTPAQVMNSGHHLPDDLEYGEEAPPRYDHL